MKSTAQNVWLLPSHCSKLEPLEAGLGSPSFQGWRRWNIPRRAWSLICMCGRCAWRSAKKNKVIWRWGNGKSLNGQDFTPPTAGMERLGGTHSLSFHHSYGWSHCANHWDRLRLGCFGGSTGRPVGIKAVIYGRLKGVQLFCWGVVFGVCGFFLKTSHIPTSRVTSWFLAFWLHLLRWDLAWWTPGSPTWKDHRWRWLDHFLGYWHPAPSYQTIPNPFDSFRIFSSMKGIRFR